MNHQEPNRGFLGIDFSNFFGNCGCVGRGNQGEESLSSARSMEQKVRLPDNLSYASNQDWQDLDEEYGGHNVVQEQGTALQGRHTYQDQPFDTYETMEPIDFDCKIYHLIKVVIMYRPQDCWNH